MKWRMVDGVPSRRLRWRWHELPGQSERGLAMNVASSPWRGGDLLDRALEQERLVGRLQRGRRAQVDLELPRARLGVARLDGEPVARAASRAPRPRTARCARPPRRRTRSGARRPPRAATGACRAPTAASRAAGRTRARPRRSARRPWPGRARRPSAGRPAATAGWRRRRDRRSRTAGARCGRATGRCGRSRGRARRACRGSPAAGSSRRAPAAAERARARRPAAPRRRRTSATPCSAARSSSAIGRRLPRMIPCVSAPARITVSTPR